MKKQIIAVLALACVGLSACGNTAESAEPKTTSAAETTTTTTAETTAETTTTEPTTTTAETTTTQATTTETPEPESDMMTVEECLQKIVKEKYEDTPYGLYYLGHNSEPMGIGALNEKKEYSEYYKDNEIIGNDYPLLIFYGNDEGIKSTRDRDYTRVMGADLYDSFMKDEAVNIKCFARLNYPTDAFDKRFDILHLFYENDPEGLIVYNPFVLETKKDYTVEEFLKMVYGEEGIENYHGYFDDFNRTGSYCVEFDKYLDEVHHIYEIHFYGIYSLDKEINLDYLFRIGEYIYIYAPEAEYFYQ